MTSLAIHYSNLLHEYHKQLLKEDCYDPCEVRQLMIDYMSTSGKFDKDYYLTEEVLCDFLNDHDLD